MTGGRELRVREPTRETAREIWCAFGVCVLRNERESFAVLLVCVCPTWARQRTRASERERVLCRAFGVFGWLCERVVLESQ